MPKSCMEKSKVSKAEKRHKWKTSKVRTMLICFFDIKGTVHYKFIPPNKTVNQGLYLQVLECLWQHGRSTLWPDKWILHQDKKMTKHPPYLPDLSLHDFSMSLKLNIFLNYFKTFREMWWLLKDFWKIISSSFQAWKRPCNACIKTEIYVCRTSLIICQPFYTNGRKTLFCMWIHVCSKTE